MSLLVTTPNVAKGIVDSIPNLQPVIFNISSNAQWAVRLDLLPPTNAIDYANSKEFDLAYASYILNNDVYFMNFFSIISLLASGKTVILLVYREEQVFDAIIESLCKLIQQRYGYNYQFLDTVEDYDGYDDSNFNYYGVMNYNEDYKRYLDLLVKDNPDAYIDKNTIE